VTTLVTAGGQTIPAVAPIVGDATALNITATTQVKVGPGRLGIISLINWGTTSGIIYDSATVGGIGPSNMIGYITTNSSATTEYNFPFQNGLVIVPGTGQAMSVSYM
jgi:hypothetical protein